MCQILQEREKSDDNRDSVEFKQQKTTVFISIWDKKLQRIYRSNVRKAQLSIGDEGIYFENAL